ncbi:MAG: DUF4125 family protein [Clostridiales Family XIII bacterium]|jgi:hypothetical protein|nr:DUF4125 family protein [Clostridiales Family XIII bacterium]
MNEYIDAIVELEWSMFSEVKNIGGRAACQDDPVTFDIMRRSQFETWDAHSLESYLDDLFLAESKGENIVAYKYAYMMAYSLPDEFERISAKLPHISEEKYAFARRLTDCHLKWHREIAEVYPKLAGRGRPELMADETAGEVSFENYTLGEFLSMSLRTLKRCDTHAEKLAHEGLNMALMTIENMVRLYGFPSIEDAEANL